MAVSASRDISAAAQLLVLSPYCCRLFVRFSEIMDTYFNKTLHSLLLRKMIRFSKVTPTSATIDFAISRSAI